MNTNHENEIKAEDKKAFKSFIIIVVVSGIIGGIFGAMSVSLKDLLGESIPNLFSNIFKTITPYASLVFSLLVIIASTVIYKNSRKEYDLWKETEEDNNIVDKIEERLSYILLFNSINMILGFFFFGMGGISQAFSNLDGGFNIIKLICFIIGFLLCMISCILIQKKIVNFEKEINPLLEGSVYDKKFAKKWLDSCDEAIKLNIYKSAYKAYSSVSITCLILWLFCIIGYELWDFGVMPMVIVTIVWLVQTISYCIASIKYSKVK